jgi:hypothetical protein
MSGNLSYCLYTLQSQTLLHSPALQYVQLRIDCILLYSEDHHALQTGRDLATKDATPLQQQRIKLCFLSAERVLPALPPLQQLLLP